MHVNKHRLQFLAPCEDIVGNDTTIVMLACVENTLVFEESCFIENLKTMSQVHSQIFKTLEFSSLVMATY